MPADFSLAELRPFTTKQQLWIASYLGEAKGNATEAARRAGYKNPEAASKDNLANPRLREAIAGYVEQKFASAEEVLHELTNVGLSEWRDFLTIIVDPKTGEVQSVRMDLGAKVKSLELLGKYHQLFTDNVRHQGEITIAIAGVDVDKL